MSGCTFSACRTLDDEQTVHVCKHEKIRCIPQFYKLVSHARLLNADDFSIIKHTLSILDSIGEYYY